MDGTGSEALPGEGVQESLLHPAEEAALYPPGMVPDPLALAGFVTCVGAGQWHAAARGPAVGAPAQAAAAAQDLVTVAACGAPARISGHGVYDRTAYPVSCGPCLPCAWTVAIATGSTERELRLLTPSPRDAAALAGSGVDPLLAVKICRAVLAEAADPDAGFELDHPAVVQILAHATAHRPVLWVPEDCAEDDRSCRHRPPGADEDSWHCDYPSATAGCAACSLRAGGWAGEYEGTIMGECRVTAPCSVLAALAARYTAAAGRRAS